mgnify:CR=1 FL=1
MTHEELLIEADDIHLIVKEKPLPISKGRIKGNRIVLRQNMSETEKKCILAEELGHHYTTVGNIMDQTKVENRKQERRARIWAYNKMISLSDLVNSYKDGCRSRYEIAEHLEVTEEFLQECLDYFHEKYGLYTKQNNYLIYFEPLGVLELYK